jgi:hypothetical protein
MKESTMSTLDIELANAITRDRERQFRDRTRFATTHQTKVQKRVLPRLRWFPAYRVRPAVLSVPAHNGTGG